MADQGGAMWVYGKVEPGWYVAKSIWSDWCAERLRELGYDVVRSVQRPGVPLESA